MMQKQTIRPTRFFSLLLVLSLALSLLAGCGAKQKETQQENNQNNEDTASGTEEWSWPLPEKKELSFWITWSSSYKNDPNEIVAVQQAEEATNVHINYITVASNEAKEKFGLMMASGDYPDILRGAESYYTGGLAKAVEDGVTYDLTDAVPLYMPRYQALRTSIPSLEKDTVTDDGRMVACYTIASKNGEIAGELPWDGLALRQDWLNEQNLEVPTTIDDWHEVLTVFKEKYQCEAPLMIGASNGYDYCNNFLSAYGVLGAFYQVDNTVHYGPLEEGYRQWVELFRQWYAEGLIDPNFITNDAATMTSFDYIGTGKAGAGSCLWGFTADWMKQAGYNQEENFFLVGATTPVLNEGDTPQLGNMMSALTKETLVITQNCKDLELACRRLDYAYSEESMFAYSYGVEGESYVQNDDGSYSLTDAFYQMQKDEGYPTAQEAMCHGARGNTTWYFRSI